MNEVRFYCHREKRSKNGSSFILLFCIAFHSPIKKLTNPKTERLDREIEGRTIKTRFTTILANAENQNRRESSFGKFQSASCGVPDGSLQLFPRTRQVWNHVLLPFHTPPLYTFSDSPFTMKKGSQAPGTTPGAVGQPAGMARTAAAVNQRTSPTLRLLLTCLLPLLLLTCLLVAAI